MVLAKLGASLTGLRQTAGVSRAQHYRCLAAPEPRDTDTSASLGDVRRVDN